ncbi:MAG: preprotein translocase subunit SecA, partial [Bacteroidia bacterium]|nr:preprotein translocase subunit SecA [Bacteroidia bacterium]
SRKGMLEYDDVMNSQREIIYQRRKNALSGERIQLDILNSFYETCEDLIRNYQGPNNFDNFKLQLLTIFGVEVPSSVQEEEFEKIAANALAATLYDTVIKHYREKNQRIINNILPNLTRLYKDRGESIEDIIIPFTDGKRQINVIANLKKSLRVKAGRSSKRWRKS